MYESFNNLLALLSQHAYVGLFAIVLGSAVGLPIPEDVPVIAAGMLAERGVITLGGAWVGCYLAVLTADTITLYIGWHFGKAVLHRRWAKRMIHPRRMLWARRQVHDHGAWVIFAARFIPGSRLPVLLFAGMMHIRRWKFFLADGIGLIFSVSIQLTIGWYFSKSISKFIEYREEMLTLLAMIGVGVLVAYGVWRWIARPRRKHAA